MTENLEKRRKQLIFRSWHRGTREMDMILGSYAEQHIETMSANDLNEYAAFLEISDPELYNWYMRKEAVPNNLDTPLMQSYLNHQVVKA